jgi:transposase
MDRQSLESLLDQGISVEQIGRRFGKDPSTVSYWMRKYGLVSPYKEKHAAKGGIDRSELEALVKSGASIATISRKLQRSHATVRHWLEKYALETRSASRLRVAKAARSAGMLKIQAMCAHHGQTEFWLEGRGAFRCSLCRKEAVSRRRRRVKRILVEEAGGACAICGYDEWIGALQFHHRDPQDKEFEISGAGITRSLDRARNEARKCVLLCSNCHAEVEAGRRPIPEATPA